MKYVSQEHKKGCAVACMAMILGARYAEVEKHFSVDFEKAGLSPDVARDYLCDHGFAAIEKLSHGYMDVRASNRRMAVPFAPVHYVCVLPYIDAKTNHAVVMDAKGRVYDPQYREVKDFSDYYCIVRVVGLYREGEARSKKGR